MANVTAATVKELREMTGAGMMDCKKALAETDGDMDKAVEYLREKGLAGSEKKAGRQTVEGLSLTCATDDGKKAAVVEVNIETDFAANTDKFKEYVNAVARQALDSSATDMDAFLAEKWAKDPSMTVEDSRKQAVADISENIGIRRFERVEEANGFVATYIHAGGKIGVIVDVETDVINDAVKEMGKNVAMQVAALSPKYTRQSEIEASYIEHEKEILKAQIENDPKEVAKPDKVKEGMIMGRINKEMKEICLVDQIYVKAEDGKQSVQKYVEEVAKANNAKINIKKFVRFQTGEGMEKKEEDYAAEVAKQIAEASK
ncbi:MAG: translation elongation factor Ts [Lachnospiraceae bacterium]|nr:translation elongation factor Ts [Lachnospiraceae bacterium]